MRTIRIRTEWRDWCARYVWILDKFIPAKKVFHWTITEAQWAQQAGPTFEHAIAERWAKHYGIELDWPVDYCREKE